ncbi:Tetraacyldisaccharide 4'-kinase [Phycisphaerae bacterium RAS2]|nr:Tetraacyldisaccharide 4'-kinase [Phycisphaerae bacterium RAS2]
MAKALPRYSDIISGRAQGALAEFARAALAGLSVPYRLAIKLRNLWYSCVPGARRRAALPVISIGNLTAGGTGKTPVSAMITNALLQRGRRVAVILRGYKGRPIQFDNDQRGRAADQWRMESDEAEVLRRRCPTARVIINPDRVAAARQAVAERCDVTVLDDGFQHRRIRRDLDIVLIDATNPFGHERLLPRGLLREPVRALRRADLILLTRSDQADETSKALLQRKLRKASGGKPVVQAVHRIAGFLDIKSRPVTVEDARAMQAVLFAGIANFQSFRQSVEQLGVHVLAAYEYPDHHPYTAEEMSGLVETATNLEANALITTEKDAVKLVGRWPDGGCPVLVVDLSIELLDDGQAVLAAALDRALAARAD